MFLGGEVKAQCSQMAQGSLRARYGPHLPDSSLWPGAFDDIGRQAAVSNHYTDYQMPRMQMLRVHPAARIMSF